MEAERAVARACITGGPRTGKTTLANDTAKLTPLVPVRHTDDLVATHDWSAASAEVSTWLDAPGPWLIEGVAIPRALRKWLAAHPIGKPYDVVVLLERARVPLAKGQQTMAKGLAKVWREIVAELLKRGVSVMTP